MAWGWQVDPCVLPRGAQSDRELTEKLGFKPKLKTSAWQKAQLKKKKEPSHGQKTSEIESDHGGVSIISKQSETQPRLKMGEGRTGM